MGDHPLGTKKQQQHKMQDHLPLVGKSYADGLQQLLQQNIQDKMSEPSWKNNTTALFS